MAKKSSTTKKSDVTDEAAVETTSAEVTSGEDVKTEEISSNDVAQSDDPLSDAEPDQDHVSAHHDTEEVLEGSGLASRVLTGLALLFLGGAIALWGGPKLAPYLPSGLAPVADFLTPGKISDAARQQALEDLVDQRLDQFEAALPSNDAQDEMNAALANLEQSQTARLDALEQQILASDGEDIEARLATVETRLSGLVAEVETLSGDLIAADTEGLGQEAIAQISRYQALVEGLRAEISTLSSAQGALSQRIDDVNVAADREVEKAQAAVSISDAKRAISQLTNAIESGGAFSNFLPAIEAAGLQLPEVLAAQAETGVTPFATLKSDFSAAAHNALKASAMAQAGDSVTGRVSAFFKSQVTIRSLEPKQGDDTDAVLSRVQGHLDNDQLAEALDQAQSLGPQARDALQGWLDAAWARHQAFEALNILNAQIEG